MADLTTTATVPANTTLEITINSDTTGDGTLDTTETVSVPDGTNTQTLTADPVEAASITVSLAGSPADGTPTLQSAEISGETQTAPEATAVSNLQITATTDTSVSLSWDQATTGDSYTILRAESSGTTAADYTQIDSVEATTTTYQDTALENGETYHYRIQTADSTTSTTALSSEVTGTTTLPAPTLSATGGQREVSLSWDKPDNNTEGSYVIYRSQEAGVQGGAIHTISDLSISSYLDTGLTDGEAYHYSIERITPDSSATSAQTAATTSLPAPTLSATGGDKQIDLSWDKPDNNPEGQWVIYRSAVEGQQGEAIQTVTDLGTTEYLDTGLTDGKEYYYTIERATPDASATSPQTEATTLPTPTLSATPGTREVSLEWDKPDDNPDGSYVIYRSQEAGVQGEVLETITNLTTLSYTDTGLTDGTAYYYTIERQTPDVTATSTQEEALTVLPTPTLSGTGGVRENALSWDTPDNNPEGDITLYRSTDGSQGTAIQTVTDLTTTGYTETGLSDATSYHYTLERNVPDTSATSTQITLATEAPEITLSVSETATEELTISWEVLDPIPDGDVTLYRTYEDEPEEQLLSTTDLSQTEYVDASVVAPSTYRYRIVRETGQGVSDEQTASITLSPPADQWWIRLEHPTLGTRTHADITSVQTTREHTALSSWGLTVPYNEIFENWSLADVYLFHGQEFLFHGILETVASDDSTGETELSGMGVGKELEDAGAFADYSGTLGYEAIRDYYQTHLPADFDGSVVDPDTTAISGESVQTADSEAEFNQILTIPETTPVAIRNGGLETLQTGWVIEGEHMSGGNGTVSDANASGGTSMVISDAASDLTYNFDTEHTIPGDQVRAQLRIRVPTANDHVGFVVEVDGEPILDIGANALSSTSYGWRFGSIISSDLQPGTHDITIDCTSEASGDVYVDVICVNDDRYNISVPNTVDANQALSGPELYPDAVPVVFEEVNTDYNVEAGQLSTTWSNTDGQQALSLSIDSGETWPHTASNTTTLEGSFSERSSLITGRATLSRSSTGSTTTPTEGDAPQRLESWDLSIDGNTLAVFDSVEVGGNHLSNLQKLHERAGLRFTIHHSQTGTPTIESYAPGEVEQPANWETVSRNREVSLSGYANRIVGRGAIPEDPSVIPSGNIDQTGHLIAESTDSEEVEAVGRTIERWIQDPSITSLDDLQSRVQTELQRATDADSVKGIIEVVPTQLPPGYEYQIPAWGADGETFALEQIQHSESPGSAGATLNFREPEGLASQITSIKRGQSNINERL